MRSSRGRRISEKGYLENVLGKRFSLGGIEKGSGLKGARNRIGFLLLPYQLIVS